MNQRIFAMDIGHGTQDIMLYDPERTIENNPKVVVTTPARVFKNLIEKTDQPLAITGYTIGGGPLRKALKDHLARGFSVTMEKGPALTIRNHYDQVKEMGFQLVDPISKDFIKSEGLSHLHFNETNLPHWDSFFTRYGDDFKTVPWVAIAVQDHGMITEKGTSRETRFEVFKKFLDSTPYPWALGFFGEEIPDNLARFQAARNSAMEFYPDKKYFLMDTSTAAMYGALLDEYHDWGPGPHLTVNIGNNHITAYVIENWRILSFFEHHTPMVRDRMEILEDYLIRTCQGNLTMAEVMSTNGSGYYCLESLPFKKIKQIIVTGPNRELLKKTALNHKFAVPGGDMMMAGPIGLIGALKKLLLEKGPPQ